MELTQNEIAVVKQVASQAHQLQIAELDDLQLTLIGGGIGDFVQ